MTKLASFIPATLGLILSLSFDSAIGSASTITYNATGTFGDGSTLSGTIAINNVSGLATAANLFESNPDSLNFNQLSAQGANYEGTGLEVVSVYTTAGNSGILLIFPSSVPSLVGYTGGGPLASTFAPANGFASQVQPDFSVQTRVSLTQGSLIPATAPEPATWAMLGSILFVAIPAIRFRRTRSELR